MTTGTPLALETPASCLTNSRPSMMGMLMSQRIRSTWLCSNTARASAPLPASSTCVRLTPAWRRERSTIFRITEESSMMSARMAGIRGPSVGSAWYYLLLYAFVFLSAVSARRERSLDGELVAGGRTGLVGQYWCETDRLPLQLTYAKTVQSVRECGLLSRVRGCRKKSKHRSRRAHRAKMFSELRFPSGALET